MKLIPLLTLLIAVGPLTAQVQLPDPLYFVAGMPDRSFYKDDYTQTYTANILKYEQDSLQEIFTLKDSTVNYLNYLRYYPDLNVVITLNETGYEPERELEIVEYSTKTLKAKTLKIPPIKQFQGLGFRAYLPSLGVLLENNSIRYSMRYSDTELTRDIPQYVPTYFGIFEGSRYVPKNVELQADIYRNGGMAGPFFKKSNSNFLTLHAHPTEHLLVIPSYLEEDSIFHAQVPEQAVLTPNRYSAAMLLNNKDIRLLFYRKGKDGKSFYDLYNKAQDRYYQYPFDQSNLCVKQYGTWIASPTRMSYTENGGVYQGRQLGEERWNPEHNKYGLSVAEYMDRKLKITILSGYLGIRSINDPTIFIEWDTRQGDSEILNIIDEVVYYRKHDEIWYVPIIDGEKLGNHKRLLKHDHVPGIHFMFVRG